MTHSTERTRLVFGAKLSRAKGSPAGCEKSFTIEGYEGDLETIGPQFVEQIG